VSTGGAIRSALVMGGGGITGTAWEIGVLAGLAEMGVDLGTADLVVGTSAGSIAGAQLRSGLGIADLYARQLEPPAGEQAAAISRTTALRFALAALRARGDEAAFRRRLGHLAARAAERGRTPTEAERRATIAGRLPAHDWPAAPLVICAVDAASGDFRPFDRGAGVPLVDAVTASCAVPGVYPPARIAGHPYIDGGVRGALNADVAGGAERVIALAPVPRGAGPVAGAQGELRGRFGRFALLTPDRHSQDVVGEAVLDPARRAPAARAGRDQGRAEARRVAAVWS
jgi:NTE family protein